MSAGSSRLPIHSAGRSPGPLGARGAEVTGGDFFASGAFSGSGGPVSEESRAFLQQRLFDEELK